MQGKTSEINVLILKVYISSIIQRRKNTVSSVEGPMMMMMRKGSWSGWDATFAGDGFTVDALA